MSVLSTAADVPLRLPKRRCGHCSARVRSSSSRCRADERNGDQAITRVCDHRRAHGCGSRVDRVARVPPAIAELCAQHNRRPPTHGRPTRGPRFTIAR
jgi:hypothetical protein